MNKIQSHNDEILKNPYPTTLSLHKMSSCTPMMYFTKTIYITINTYFKTVYHVRLSQCYKKCLFIAKMDSSSTQTQKPA